MFIGSKKKLKLGYLYFPMLIGKILISYYFETEPLVITRSQSL
jgi:hypothetical protein